MQKRRLWHRFFSCEFCEISKNIFFTEHIWVTASEISLLIIREFKRIANGFLVILGGNFFSCDYIRLISEAKFEDNPYGYSKALFIDCIPK